MIGYASKRKPKDRHKKPRSNMEHWYAPKITDVYAQFQIAQTMLMRIPDAELAIVKREMAIVEDMLWQFCHQ